MSIEIKYFALNTHHPFFEISLLLNSIACFTSKELRVLLLATMFRFQKTKKKIKHLNF